MENNKYYIFLCVRVRVCAGVWARERVYVCERLALLIHNKKRMRYIVLAFVASLDSSHFSILTHKLYDFRKKVIELEICSDFNYKLLYFSF